jgi:hypothetical protein
MVRDYRAWLQSELQLLGNAGQHAYSLGQANMAKRAIERLDAEIGDRVLLELEPELADGITDALEQLAQVEALPEPLVELLQLSRTAQQ